MVNRIFGPDQIELVLSAALPLFRFKTSPRGHRAVVRPARDYDVNRSNAKTYLTSGHTSSSRVQRCPGVRNVSNSQGACFSSGRDDLLRGNYEVTEGGHDGLREHREV